MCVRNKQTAAVKGWLKKKLLHKVGFHKIPSVSFMIGLFSLVVQNKLETINRYYSWFESLQGIAFVAFSPCDNLRLSKGTKKPTSTQERSTNLILTGLSGTVNSF